MSDLHLLAEALGNTCLDEEYFGADGPCPVSVEPGNPETGLLVVSGDNGSGKSLFLRALKAHLRRADADIVIIDADARARTFSGFERSHIDANDEDGDSIAAIFSTGTMNAIADARAATAPSLLMLDDPDIGLSDAWAAAIGREIAELVRNMPDALMGIVVASHRRPLIGSLTSLEPSFVRIGTDRRPTLEWLAGGPAAGNETIAGMKSDIRKRWLRIEKIMTARRRAICAPSENGSKTRPGRRRRPRPND